MSNHKAVTPVVGKGHSWRRAGLTAAGPHSKIPPAPYLPVTVPSPPYIVCRAGGQVPGSSPTIQAERTENAGGLRGISPSPPSKLSSPLARPGRHSPTSALPTFWILVLLRDVHARVAAHRLGADVPSNAVSVRRILLLGVVGGIVDPGDAVGVYLGKDEGHVEVQVHVALSDRSDGSRAALEHPWWGGAETACVRKPGATAHPRTRPLAAPRPSLSPQHASGLAACPPHVAPSTDRPGVLPCSECPSAGQTLSCPPWAHGGC